MKSRLVRLAIQELILFFSLPSINRLVLFIASFPVIKQDNTAANYGIINMFERDFLGIGRKSNEYFMRLLRFSIFATLV
jgi:hypothetical protein